jgi:hypothetical protein
MHARRCRRQAQRWRRWARCANQQTGVLLYHIIFISLYYTHYDTIILHCDTIRSIILMLMVKSMVSLMRPISFVIWFSWNFWSWMVLFAPLLDQFVSSFARANLNVLSIFENDTDCFIGFSTRNLINRFNGLGTLFLPWKFKNPRSRFGLELMVIFVWIKTLKIKVETGILPENA